MNNYNSYVGKLASNLESNNMQKHMGTMTDNVSSKHGKILQNIIDYECNEFINLIYKTALGNNEKYYDGEPIKHFFIENEQDLLSIFSKINEDCLNDPEFSNAIVNGKLYTKNMGTKRDYVLYHLPNHVGSVSNDIYMNLLYIPSKSHEQPNKFRIDVKECLGGKQEYPYINFSVDIGDDESIVYNQPTIVNKQNKEEDSSITRTPSDMSAAHIYFNEKGIESLKEMFMYLFEKANIKENTSNKYK